MQDEPKCVVCTKHYDEIKNAVIRFRGCYKEEPTFCGDDHAIEWLLEHGYIENV